MGVNLPKPVFMHKDGKKGFTLVLTDLEPDFPNKSARGAMGVRELKVSPTHGNPLMPMHG